MLGFSPISCQNTLGQPHYYLPQHVEKKWKSWRAPAGACLLPNCTNLRRVDEPRRPDPITPKHQTFTTIHFHKNYSNLSTAAGEW